MTTEVTWQGQPHPDSSLSSLNVGFIPALQRALQLPPPSLLVILKEEQNGMNVTWPTWGECISPKTFCVKKRTLVSRIRNFIAHAEKGRCFSSVVRKKEANS